MPAKMPPAEPAPQATFVFQGTVQKIKAVTMADVPISNRTVIVRIDHLIQAPEALRDYAGHEITVQLAPDEKVKAGESYVFYTNGWIFGEGLAVQSIKLEVATPGTVAAMSMHPD